MTNEEKNLIGALLFISNAYAANWPQDTVGRRAELKKRVEPILQMYGFHVGMAVAQSAPCEFDLPMIRSEASQTQ